MKNVNSLRIANIESLECEGDNKIKTMNNLKKIFLVLTLGVASFSFSQSSDVEYASATINESYCIELDSSIDLKEFYSADASVFGWTSAVDARKHCGYHSNNLVTLTPDFDNGLVLIQIHADRAAAAYDVTWWNEYLQSICK